MSNDPIDVATLSLSGSTTDEIIDLLGHIREEFDLAQDQARKNYCAQSATRIGGLLNERLTGWAVNHLKSNGAGEPSFSDDENVRDLLKKLDAHRFNFVNAVQRQKSQYSGVQKNYNSRKAIELCAQLSAYVAQWAIDDQLYRAIDDSGGQILAGMNDARELKHLEGHATDENSLPDATVRTGMRYLLEAGIGAIPTCIAWPMAHALDEIDHGIKSSLLMPKNAKSRTPLKKLRLEIYALGYIAFSETTVGRGAVTAARESVAEAYDVRVETVESWGRPARSKGKRAHDIEAHKKRCTEAGKLYLTFREGLNDPIPGLEATASAENSAAISDAMANIDRYHGMPALKLWGRIYRQMAYNKP